MRFEHWVRRASEGLTLLAALCLILMMVQMVADVALTYFFRAPIEGNLQIVSFYYMVGVVFLPLAMVELKHEHISMDLFVRLLPKAVQSYVYAAGCLVSATFFGLLGYQTLLDAIRSTRTGEVMMGSIYVTIWPARWALPAGFAVILLATLIHACRAVRDPQGFDPTPADPEIVINDPS